MIGFRHCRRLILAMGTGLLLAGCQIIPDVSAPTSPPPPTQQPQGQQPQGQSTPGPVTGDARTPPPIPRGTPTPAQPAPLPSDETRHRVALLVPMSGDNARVGQSVANATTMALLDTNANNLRITTYDTAGDPRSAARRAVAEGNQLILGPLLGSNVADVVAEARPAGIPLIAFSNDVSVASPDVYLMGVSPSQSVDRSVQYAQRQGARNYAALVPQGEYGRQAELALIEALRSIGGSLVATERYSRNEGSAASAARRLQARGGFDTVMIADSPRLAIVAASELRGLDGTGPRLLGTELWSGESAIPDAGVMDGSLFSALSDGRYRNFSESYRSRFGDSPYRIATLGYDSVLLALRVAGGDWRPGTPFPTGELTAQGGFLGLDGAFRFRSDGTSQRALEVREVRDGQVVVVSPAPDGF
ncbi:penicillin-binding protein activator [Alteriqipengyuania lutimaris]|uniref:Penicillin-binding protein activator n=1 Tax=Alteriqipengyuania lutimaris TaxID=1538146 RepID=A0A395LNM5_9SPHN|nr:penicillin-binding protein activator [Alteriqipengyuania lutimaris]MBB3032906.1 ABC-type branched-subunit amino acid transport system substrate-binding protein [Alteriqipengyuania lutimaris]RDS78007.1 penicillin-binding protein activator [Alteriqipengyuania lutimaris]